MPASSPTTHWTAATARGDDYVDLHPYFSRLWLFCHSQAAGRGSPHGPTVSQHKVLGHCHCQLCLFAPCLPWLTCHSLVAWQGTSAAAHCDTAQGVDYVGLPLHLSAPLAGIGRAVGRLQHVNVQDVYCNRIC